ncbi:MAG: ACP S-malonyltransferase [Limnobacter sp.]|nr:ACP S-malonyltransferase [Limnobacter sp.]
MIKKKTAFLFPGQGSQAVGMLNDLESDPRLGPVCQPLLKQADAALGQSLSQLIAQGPAEQLNLTVNTQPAMLLADIVVFEAWKAAGGVLPDMVAGHSLGEYAALVAAKGLSLVEGLRLVRIRAQAMQEAVPVGQGSMAAILGLPDSTVQEVCARATEGTELAQAVNFNAPNQVVIAGTTAGVSRACELAKEAGAKRALVLPVSAPFHSTLMQPASEVLGRALAETHVSDLHVPLYTNVDVCAETQGRSLKDALVRQAFNPVRWVETIEKMQADGADVFIECGPGKVLANLVKRISDKPVFSVCSAQSIAEVVQEFENLG